MSTARTEDGWVTAGDDSSPFARWERSLYRDEDGDLFLPAANFGDEGEVVLAATRDGVPMIKRWRHVYVLFHWARLAYPYNTWAWVFRDEESPVYRDEDGDLFLPAADFGDEDRVVLAAVRDGVPLVKEWGHAFVPLTWARRKYPDNFLIKVFDR